MRKQVIDYIYGVIFLFSKANIEHRSVCLGNHTVYGQRHRDPLIFLNAAIIVRFSKCQIMIFIERIRAKIESGRIQMRSDHIAAFRRIFPSDNSKKQSLTAVNPIYFHSRFQRNTAVYYFLKINISLTLCFRLHHRNSFAFCFCVI